jgi:Ca2+-transporting ATPase
LRADESVLTGEANPTKKHHYKIDEFDVGIADRKNMAFMGTMIVQGKGKGVVVALGDNTELGKISQMIQTSGAQKTPLQLKMDQLGKHLSIMSFASE